MSERLSVWEYLEGDETLRPTELVWGIVREPPAPKFGHQMVVTRAAVLLEQHVRSLTLGIVCVSPIDVVLDAQKGLVVQPDVIFISQERASIVRDQVWGAPDLVLEVLSRSTAKRDRTTKLGWYREYGVRECWLLDPRARTVEIVDLSAAVEGGPTFQGEQPVQSLVLPEFHAEASALFD